MALYDELHLPTASPSAQASNRATWNSRRSQADANFFTVGYSGRHTTDFATVLRAAGICSVVDIRFSPVSIYRPEFSKGNLRRLLAKHGIEYCHRPDLGVPRDVRGLAVGEDNREAIWQWYDRYVASQYVRNLDDFFNRTNHPVAFLCVEADPMACHRHRLSLALEGVGLTSFDL